MAIADIMKAGHDGKLEEARHRRRRLPGELTKGDKVFISGGKIGELTQKLYDTTASRQAARHQGWIVPKSKG